MELPPKHVTAFLIWFALNMCALAESSPQDLAALQGKWNVESSTLREKSDLFLKGFTFEFRDGKLSCFGLGPPTMKEELMCSISFDSTQSPKAITVTNPKSSKTTVGIYKIEGNKLTLCLGSSGQKPSDFSGRQAGEVVVFVPYTGEEEEAVAPAREQKPSRGRLYGRLGEPSPPVDFRAVARRPRPRWESPNI